MRWSIYGDEGGFASVFLGQSYSFNDTNNFDNGSGLDTHMSDIVGAVYINPADYLDLMYRFRLDADSFQAQRDELLMQAGPDWLNVNVSYAFLSEEADPNSGFGDRQEIAARLNTKFDEYWSAFIAARRIWSRAACCHMAAASPMRTSVLRSVAPCSRTTSRTTSRIPGSRHCFP